jgi:hypothetical protein
LSCQLAAVDGVGYGGGGPAMVEVGDCTHCNALRPPIYLIRTQPASSFPSVRPDLEGGRTFNSLDSAWCLCRCPSLTTLLSENKLILLLLERGAAVTLVALLYCPGSARLAVLHTRTLPAHTCPLWRHLPCLAVRI